MIYLIVKVFGGCRKLFQRDAPGADARLHRSTVLSMFRNYHGTKKVIFSSKFLLMQLQKKSYKITHLF